MHETHHKPKITYPVEWEYKVIGLKEENLEEIVADIFKKLDKPYKIEHSKESKEGKYRSLKIEANVESEGERLKIFQKLKESPNLMFVL